MDFINIYSNDEQIHPKTVLGYFDTLSEQSKDQIYTRVKTKYKMMPMA